MYKYISQKKGLKIVGPECSAKQHSKIQCCLYLPNLYLYQNQGRFLTFSIEEGGDKTMYFYVTFSETVVLFVHFRTCKMKPKQLTLFFISIYMNLSIHLSIHLSILLTIHLSIHPPIYPTIHLSIFIYIYPSI